MTLHQAEPTTPVYDGGWLGALLPGIARALGAPLPAESIRVGWDSGLAADPAVPLPKVRLPKVPLPEVRLPPAERVCLVLIDGLGAGQLAEAAASGGAPFLAGLMDAAGGRTLRAGCPSTTAASMASLGTGLPPGQHGIVGYRVRDPERGVLVNQLRWDPYTDPISWQPRATIFSRLAAEGVSVSNIGAPEFAGSGLTVAAHRGAFFRGFESLPDRVDAAVSSLSTSGGALTYLYWGAVDKAGHEKGWRSPEWAAELRACDGHLARLADALPSGTKLIISADHGMVDVSHSRRLDIAARPELRAGVGLYGGEPRMVQLYARHRTEEGVAELAARFAEAVGDGAWVRTRAEAVAAGWFGPVDPRVSDRIGDVLIAARGDFSLVDSAIMDRHGLALIGHHGSLTDAEMIVPLLVAQL